MTCRLESGGLVQTNSSTQFAAADDEAAAAVLTSLRAGLASEERQARLRSTLAAWAGATPSPEQGLFVPQPLATLLPRARVCLSCASRLHRVQRQGTHPMHDGMAGRGKGEPASLSARSSSTLSSMKVGGPWFGGGKTAASEEGPSGRPTHKLRALVKSRTTDQLEQPAAPGIHNVHDLIAVRCLFCCSSDPVSCECRGCSSPAQTNCRAQAKLDSTAGFCCDRVTTK